MRLLTLLLALVMALTLAPATAVADQGTRDDAYFTRLLNRERTTRSVHKLRTHREIDRIAYRHSKRMGHSIDRDGRCNDASRLHHRKPIWRNVDAPWTKLSENVGYYCSSQGAREKITKLHRALMASRGHRANMLDRQVRWVGVGSYRDADGGVWVTQVFMRL